jgi:hypothetical protein
MERKLGQNDLLGMIQATSVFWDATWVAHASNTQLAVLRRASG